MFDLYEYEDLIVSKIKFTDNLKNFIDYFNDKYSPNIDIKKIIKNRSEFICDFYSILHFFLTNHFIDSSTGSSVNSRQIDQIKRFSIKNYENIHNFNQNLVSFSDVFGVFFVSVLKVLSDYHSVLMPRYYLDKPGFSRFIQSIIEVELFFVMSLQNNDFYLKTIDLSRKIKMSPRKNVVMASTKKLVCKR